MTIRRFQLLAELLVVSSCSVPAFAGFRAVGWTTELTVAILLFLLPAGPNVRHVSLHQVSFAAIGTVAVLEVICSCRSAMVGGLCSSARLS